jgi:hypothetical protein
MPAGYSGTPQAKKLGIKPHQRLCLDDPPDDWSLTDPSSGVILVPPPSLPTSSSASSAPAMNSRPAREVGATNFPHRCALGCLASARRRTPQRYPREPVRRHTLPLGLVDVKIAAIFDDRSALRLVWRRENRSGR